MSTRLSLAENVEAPVEQGQKLGEMAVLVDGQVRETIPIVAGEAVERLTVPGILGKFLRRLFMAE